MTEAELRRTALAERYAIERELGRGGMGAVYLARDRRLDRPVALKVLPREFAEVPDLRERFLRETRLAAGFSHPNIVPVFAIEEHAGLLAFAMGFVEGESLAARVAREGPLSARDAVRLLQDVAYALAYAHGRGVVHRDIKPDNIMIERATGRALVMDFGIARTIATAPDQSGLTRVGEVVGTPEYMSPEQATGDVVDGRADLYSLGLVAWYALTGRTVFTGETTQRILVRQLTEAIPSLATARSDLPAALTAVIDRCCAKEASERYPTAEALVEALEAAQLAGPVVPVAVRLLVPELTAVLVRGLTALVLTVYGTSRLLAYGNGNVFSVALIALALTWVKALSTVQEARRLARSGFTPAVLHRMLHVVQAERDEVRAQRRLDGALVARRRRRVRVAGSLLLLLLASEAAVLRQARIIDGDANLTGRLDVLVFFAAMLGCAVAAAVLASSPFRRPVTEQLFRITWTSRLGRGLLGLMMRGATPDSTTHRRTPLTRPENEVVAAPRTARDVAALAAQLQTFESRLERLEEQLRDRDRPSRS